MNVSGLIQGFRAWSWKWLKRVLPLAALAGWVAVYFVIEEPELQGLHLALDVGGVIGGGLLGYAVHRYLDQRELVLVYKVDNAGETIDHRYLTRQSWENSDFRGGTPKQRWRTTDEGKKSTPCYLVADWDLEDPEEPVFWATWEKSHDPDEIAADLDKLRETHGRLEALARTVPQLARYVGGLVREAYFEGVREAARETDEVLLERENPFWSDMGEKIESMRRTTQDAVNEDVRARASIQDGLDELLESDLDVDERREGLEDLVNGDPDE